MRPSFHPRLINEPFSDPGLFIPFLFEKRALLFDLGDLGRLSSRDLLKVSHGFVTHTHMDHFIGFDTLIRIFLGRRKDLHLFGPPDFLKRVEGKLSGYTWNLVEEYEEDLLLHASEVWEDRVLTKTYSCRRGFRPIQTESRAFSGRLLEEPSFSIHAVLLDHRIPCLGYSLTENFYVNVKKEGLKELGLPVGPWLNRFKEAIYCKEDPNAPFTVSWREEGEVFRERVFPLGDLTHKIGKITPGQKITYVTDVAGSEENRRKIIALAEGSDILFIEAPFLSADQDAAREKCHLTAGLAGEIAKEAGVRRIEVFHFSPRYRGRAEELVKEAKAAYEG
jgi:ribonuclease Z